MPPEINPVEQLLREANPLLGIGFDIDKRAGYTVAVWAEREFNRVVHSNDYECVDNDRWCRVGFPDEEAEYNELAAHGCCGSCDWEATDNDGQVWRFGFNYGH